ncbi:MAG: hypothetical protein RH946_00855 [Rhodospirillales bacterium]
MSRVHMDSTWEKSLAVHEKLVLICLSFYADDQGRVTKALPRLAAEASISVDDLHDVLTTLKVEGALEIIDLDLGEFQLRLEH